MARIHGSKGQLYAGIAAAGVAESIAFITKWSMDFSTDDVDVTAFGDTNKAYVSGLPDASGSFEGFYDTATAQTYTAAIDGTARKLYLYPSTPSTAGPYWWGTAFLDFSIDTAVGDAVKIKGNFKAASPFTKVG